MRIQSWMDLFGQEPRGNGSPECLAANGTTSYGWSGYALTASTRKFFANKNLAPVTYCGWTLVWNPRGYTQCGVRLVHMDDGPTNITQFAEMTGRSEGTPIHTIVDVTSTINTLILGGTFKHIGHQMKGTGTVGPYVFFSGLEFVWELGEYTPPTPPPSTVPPPSTIPPPSAILNMQLQEVISGMWKFKQIF